MKEDKLDKEIAASLKKKLLEASAPYELGAWEGFQKMRAQRRRRTIAYWVTGIAASLLLIAVGINSVDITGIEEFNPQEVQLAEKVDSTPENALEKLSSSDSNKINSDRKASVEPGSKRIDSDIEVSGKPSDVTESETAKTEIVPVETLPSKTNNLAIAPELLEKPAKTEQPKVSLDIPVLSNEKVIAQVPEKSSTTVLNQNSIIEKEVDKKPENLNSLTQTIAPETLVSAEVPVPGKPTDKEIFIAESEFPVIEKDKTSVGLGMGLTPGFGAIQNDNQVATASTIGLGMLVDVKLPGKLTLGSGFGFNYFSQNAKAESMVMNFGNSYPQTEKLEVRQMQVEIPVFVKYPVTRNNSVSIQAGFSNFYSLEGTASQEFTVQRQSAFYANDALGNSSVTLRQQDVVQSNSLESKSGKFYPFATLNFGVNLRVLETKGANYVIMPFYNYQLTQVSGYGDTYGLFGASFKMNFGGK
ncbi:porin family protein [Algoriphagus yeomjeoni]|uniref:Uncharacterized protein n=1 Tax=Algoriphagus yeomjeoni TaxID=291403 RepID=A0A327PAK4_9BACT|nr:outer membrane beta-barrel protein [Algoriphagus yeomjeoni]RAI89245.1 hypothetical protein LV83_02286 [Algoriphagus yeomjeoni]